MWRMTWPFIFLKTPIASPWVKPWRDWSFTCRISSPEKQTNNWNEMNINRKLNSFANSFVLQHHVSRQNIYVKLLTVSRVSKAQAKKNSGWKSPSIIFFAEEQGLKPTRGWKYSCTYKRMAWSYKQKDLPSNKELFSAACPVGNTVFTNIPKFPLGESFPPKILKYNKNDFLRMLMKINRANYLGIFFSSYQQ